MSIQKKSLASGTNSGKKAAGAKRGTSRRIAVRGGTKMSSMKTAATPNIGSQSSGAGAGKITFNPFSITRK
jgi:hypothetical protein